MRIRNFIVLNLVLLILLTCAGCFSAKYPIQAEYLLDVKKPIKLTQKANSQILEINNVVIAPQFAQFSFVYRTTNVNYTTDYYNVFFAPPAQQIDQSLVNYLRATNIFKHVTNDSGFIHMDYIIYPEIIELYADYRNRNNPQSILTMHFTLVSNNNANIVLNKTYHSTISLLHKDSASLVYGWSKGLGNIYNNLANDLDKQLKKRDKSANSKKTIE